jgi:hypothetical protein
MRSIVMGFFLPTVISLLSVLPAAASDPAADTKLLLKALSPSLPVDFCKEEVPLTFVKVKERFEKEMLLILWDRPQVLLWLKRSRRYFPEIERQLSTQRMPTDLKFLAVVESALRPHSGSSQGAVGFWQLMPETARKYGLRVDGRIDERRAIIPSTQAALTYLQVLYEKLQSWTLVVAAYNMGEEGLLAEMLEQGTQDFYQLYLPLETQRLVLRVIVAKLIFNHPERYGFHLKDKDYYPPLQYDSIVLDSFDEVPLSLVAKAAYTPFKVIKDLNPELRGHYLSEGSRKIRLPKDTSKGFLERFRTLTELRLKNYKQRIYIVKPGDNLTTIAKQHNVPLAALLIWNRLNLNQPIHPGDRIIIRPNRTKTP